MKKNKNDACAPLDLDQLLLDLRSPDENIRGRAVRLLCPCHAGWTLFEQHIDLVNQLKKDPSPTVRAHALHVFQDAVEMQSNAYPTHPREVRDEMLRTHRASRFRPDDVSEEAEPKRRKGHCEGK